MTSRFALLLSLSTLIALVGCGSSSGSGSGGTGGSGGISATSPCAFYSTVSGALSADLGPDGMACVTAVSTGSGIDVTFGPNGSPVASVEMQIENVTQGETGKFPGSATIRDPDTNRWIAGDCSFDISAQQDQGPAIGGERYRVVGSGTCGTAQPQSGVSGTVSLSPFDFVTVLRWAP